MNWFQGFFVRRSETLPVFTAVIAIVCLGTVIWDRWALALIFDRAAIETGAWWRLVTGHFVHFSVSHLTFDLMVFVVAAFFVERASRWRFVTLFVLSAVTISAVLYWAEPEMAYYGGMSGVACAYLFAAALEGLRGQREIRWLCCAAMLVATVKILFELCNGTSLLSSGNNNFVPMHLSHVVGALVAVGLFVVSRRSISIGN